MFFDKFSDGARAVMALAQDEARALDQQYVGTEHLLLALIKQNDGIAAQVLKKLGVNYESALISVEEITDKDEEEVPGGHIPFTPTTKRVLENAYKVTIESNVEHIKTQHLLLGIMKEEQCSAAKILASMDIDAEDVMRALHEVKASEDEDDKDPIERIPRHPSEVRMGPMGIAGRSRKGSILREYAKDLTLMAKAE